MTEAKTHGGGRDDIMRIAPGVPVGTTSSRIQLITEIFPSHLKRSHEGGLRSRLFAALCGLRASWTHFDAGLSTHSPCKTNQVVNSAARRTFLQQYQLCPSVSTGLVHAQRRFSVRASGVVRRVGNRRAVRGAGVVAHSAEPLCPQHRDRPESTAPVSLRLGLLL